MRKIPFLSKLRPKLKSKLKPKLKQKLKFSKFIERINPELFEKFWKKTAKKADVAESPIFINTLARGYFSFLRRHILGKFVEKHNLKAYYITDITQIIESPAANKSDTIFIASGDGFFDAIIGNEFFNNKKIGFFPMGVGNAVFSFFYKKKRYVSLMKKQNFYETEIDVIKIKHDKKFSETICASIGVDAEFTKLHPPRSKKGFVDYFKGIVAGTMLSKTSYPMNLYVDGNKIAFKHAVNLTFGKMPFYGFKVRCLPYHVKPSDGVIYGLLCKSIIKNEINKIVRLIGLFSVPFRIYTPVLKKLQGKKFVIYHENPFPLQSGGEFLGYYKKVEASVYRKQKFIIS